MGMLAIVFSKVDEVLPFIIEKSNELGITVADGQSERIYWPGQAEERKPWWKLW